MRKRRLFVGVALNRQCRAACAEVSEALRATGFAAKYEAAEKLHVTLAFLGFVEPLHIERIVSTLAACAASSRTCAVTLDKLGGFPHERKPRIAYVGARSQGTAFRDVARAVREAYASLGFEFGQDAVAHVTIARVKQSKRPLPLLNFAPIPLAISALTLFESLPDPARRTSRYAALETAALGDAR